MIFNIQFYLWILILYRSWKSCFLMAFYYYANELMSELRSQKIAYSYYILTPALFTPNYIYNLLHFEWPKLRRFQNCQRVGNLQDSEGKPEEATQNG